MAQICREIASLINRPGLGCSLILVNGTTVFPLMCMRSLSIIWAFPTCVPLSLYASNALLAPQSLHSLLLYLHRFILERHNSLLVLFLFSGFLSHILLPLGTSLHLETVPLPSYLVKSCSDFRIQLKSQLLQGCSALLPGLLELLISAPPGHLLQWGFPTDFVLVCLFTWTVDMSAGMGFSWFVHSSFSSVTGLECLKHFYLQNLQK